MPHQEIIFDSTRKEVTCRRHRRHVTCEGLAIEVRERSATKKELALITLRAPCQKRGYR